MNDKRKKILILLSLGLFNLAIVSLGTYALWTTGEDLITGNNSISSGQVKMSYTETNEIGMNNALPMKDDKGKLLTNYFDFSVLSYIKTGANDDTQRKLNYNIILEPLSVDNPLDDNEIKVYLTMVNNGIESVVLEPTTIDNLNDYILKSQEETFSNNKGEVITNYRLRAWLDESVDTNKLNTKSYSYKFRVNVNNEAAPAKKLTAIEFAQANVGQNGLEQITHTIDDTLQVDSKFATEYRYRGGDSVVNNYVTFNNETWRIIGVIPTEDTDGNVENRFKIIKDESIGDMAWNTTEDTTTNSYNNWITATLNTYLNNDYYNTLTSDAKNMIGTTKYYLGGYNSTSITTDVMWQYERKNGSNRTGYYYGTNPIMQNEASKKIALMYASDYGYAASKECTSNLYGYDNSACKTTNNWLDKSVDTWLLVQYSNYSSYAFSANSSGSVYSNINVNFLKSAVHPVLNLSSKVKISDGDGTLSNPYQLSIS